MSMNEKQKKIARGVAVVLALMVIYPPFAQHGPNGYKSSNGFALIFSGPTGYTLNIVPAVDVVQLLVQVLVVCAIAAALLYSVKD
jgi:hypothetical protein